MARSVGDRPAAGRGGLAKRWIGSRTLAKNRVVDRSDHARMPLTCEARWPRGFPKRVIVVLPVLRMSGPSVTLPTAIPSSGAGGSARRSDDCAAVSRMSQDSRSASLPLADCSAIAQTTKRAPRRNAGGGGALVGMLLAGLLVGCLPHR